MTERGRVLLVDDDETFLELTARRLGRAGYVVHSAASWADVIPMMREGIDLCLLDVHLVSLGGDRICSILKKSYRKLKVVLFSSDDPERLAQMAIEVGADGSLSKDLPWAQVLEEIDMHLQRAKIQ